jgi:3-deoxy-D-manno-octulosonic-acid transferase
MTWPYAVLGRLAAPALGLWLARRARQGKEDPARLDERRGAASLPRPPGRLLWIHGASLGEARSALPLLARILDDHPRAEALVTTGTLSSARMLAGALPPRARHQFAPLDVPGWVARFLDHWRPDAALWVESELWPNMLAALAARGVPAALVNARLSDASYVRWRRMAAALRPPLGAFDRILAQSDADAARFAASCRPRTPRWRRCATRSRGGHAGSPRARMPARRRPPLRRMTSCAPRCPDC